MIKIFVGKPEKTEDIMCAALIFASLFTSFQMSEHTQWVLPTSLVVLVDVQTCGMMVSPTVVPAIKSDTAQARV